MPYKIDDSVKVTGKILKRTSEGSSIVILKNTPGKVKKVDNDHYYVLTKHGMHYVKEDKLSPGTPSGN